MNAEFNYTYGYVVNKNHNTMQSGDSLVGLLWYQEMAIVPDPGILTDFIFFVLE
ncbi:MAG: hypothetical protein IPK10_04325 [Bacteroidetes bacterium]|nr:hypothetical protein [Bacteroidota bacterium]